MTKKIAVQGYITTELYDEMEEYRRQKGMNRSNFLAQAVGLFLAEGDITPDTKDLRIVGNRTYKKGVTRSGKPTWRLVIDKQAINVEENQE